MRTAHLVIVFCLVLASSALCHVPARADHDEGAASFFPWSGYWWPHKAGGLTGPLSKYDRLNGTGASQWERQAHVDPNAPDWFGHCHAWAAASVSEREPKQQRRLRQVTFGIGDQKGLLSACHGQDIANSYGDRYGDGRGSESPADLQPDELWRLLQTYVHQRKIPLILDLEAGKQVWNYPIYSYRVDYQPSSDGWYRGTMQVMAADNDVYPDFVGTDSALHKYTFRVRFQNGAIVAGSGEWTGPSIVDHPDFAWYPYVAVAENPEIDVAQVTKIVGYPVGGGNSPPGEGEDETPGPPSDDPPPVEEDDDSPPVGQPVPWDELLSPEELVDLVTNKTSHFALDIFTDRGDGGRYKIGEPVVTAVQSGEDGYLYLFDVDPEGDLHLIFPTQGKSNQIKKDQLYDIPSSKQKPWFLAQSPGQHDIKGIVTKRPLRLSGFHQDQQNQGQAQQEESVSQGKPTDKKQKQQPKQKQKQNQTQQQKPRPVQTIKPRPMVVYPTCRMRCRRRLIRCFRKGDPEDVAAPQKVQQFAQDVTSYFVLMKNQDTDPEQQQRQTPAKDS